jgi:hypothetical protein
LLLALLALDSRSPFSPQVFGIAKKKDAVVKASAPASHTDLDLHKKVIVKTGQPIVALQGEDAAGAGVERVSLKRSKFLVKKNAKKERQGKQVKAKPANKIAIAHEKAAAAAASSPMDDLTSFESALAGVDTRGSAAIPVKQTNKRRSKNMVICSPSTPLPHFISCDSQVSEVDRFQAVLLHPAFKANPFATVFEHLENSITSMHAKATAKAEEKEIRSQSKVHYLFFFSCQCVVSFVISILCPFSTLVLQALKERTEGKPVPVKGSVKSTKQQRKQTDNARQMSGAFFASKRKARLEFDCVFQTIRRWPIIFCREARERDRKSPAAGAKSSSRFVKGGIGKKSFGGGVKPQHSGGRRGLQ